MTYYKVKANYDNYTRFVYRKNGKTRDGILIANELYTPSEFKSIANNLDMFEVVNIPKSKIYWFFGARFA